MKASEGRKRAIPCASCVSRLANNPTHVCHDQIGTGARCCECANQNHSCRDVSLAAQGPVRRFVAAAAAYLEDYDKKGDYEKAGVLAQRAVRAGAARARPTAAAAAAAGGGLSDDDAHALHRCLRLVEAICTHLMIPMEDKDEVEEDGDPDGSSVTDLAIRTWAIRSLLRSDRK